MPRRQTVFVQDQIYHVLNKGVAGLPVFFSNRDYSRFLRLIDYYRFADTPTSFSHFLQTPSEVRQPILDSLQKKNNIQVEILAFCLMPNHFHLLIKQVKNNGILKFMSNVQNGYVKYINTKEKRAGPLFQAVFKAKWIETDEQLLHVSRYIHLNPVTAYLVKPEQLLKYSWFSLPFYLDRVYIKPSFLNTNIINNFFETHKSHQDFIYNQIDYQRELAKIKHLMLE